MDFSDKIQRKRGITHVPSFICEKGYFCLFDLEIEVLTLKMTLYHKNNTINGLPSQNHMKMTYYTCSWLHLLKKTYLTLKYLAAILFLPLKNSAQGCQSGTRLISAQDTP